MALANGQKITRGPYFLAFLYQEIFEAIKLTPRNDNNLVVVSGCDVLWFLQLCLQFYFPSLCRCTAFPPVSLQQSISFGRSFGCPEPFSSGNSFDFSRYFWVFYIEGEWSTGRSAPFGSRKNDPSWFRERFEYICNQAKSAKLIEHSSIWYSFLGSQDLHISLKSRSKLVLSTEVYSSHFAARQFGFIQALPAPASYFTVNSYRTRHPVKGVAKMDRVTTAGNLLKRHFIPVSIESVADESFDELFERSWDDAYNVLFGVAFIEMVDRFDFKIDPLFKSEGKISLFFQVFPAPSHRIFSFFSPVLQLRFLDQPSRRALLLFRLCRYTFSLLSLLRIYFVVVSFGMFLVSAASFNRAIGLWFPAS